MTQPQPSLRFETPRVETRGMRMSPGMTVFHPSSRTIDRQGEATQSRCARVLPFGAAFRRPVRRRVLREPQDERYWDVQRLREMTAHAVLLRPWRVSPHETLFPNFPERSSATVMCSDSTAKTQPEATR
jgi:hypothetical protein